MSFAAVQAFFQGIPAMAGGWGLQLAVAATVVTAFGLGYTFIGGGTPSLPDLNKEMIAVNELFGPVFDYSGADDAATNEAHLAKATEAKDKFIAFQKHVIAVFPTLYDKEGQEVEKFNEEYGKLAETYKEKPEELTIFKTITQQNSGYSALHQDYTNSVKSVEDISARKQRYQARIAREQGLQGLLDTGAALDMRLKEDNALVKDTTLEQDVANFVASVKSMYDGRMPTKLYNLYEQILTRVDVLKRGGGRPVVDPTKPKKVQKYDLKKKEPIKPTQMITLEEEKQIKGHKEFRLKYEKKHGTKPTTPKKKTEKGGLGWWWVVIIGGILAVLGVVAYLFLGSDASNDEEWSPEEEAL